MDAARLDRQVTFEQPNNTDDGYGGVVPGWQNAYTCFANFRYLRTGESVMNMRLAGREAIIVKIRRNNTSRSIDGTWRMTWDGKTYNVRGVQQLGDRRWLEILVDGGEA